MYPVQVIYNMVGEIDEGGKSSTYNLSGPLANQVSSVSTISDVSSIACSHILAHLSRRLVCELLVYQ